jgi:diguanylate cyclase (GGDEF)-like protein
MHAHIDVIFVTNVVSMLRADIDGAILVSDDEEEARFYDMCIHKTGRVIPAGGSALQVLGIAETRGAKGVAATIRGTPTKENDGANVFRPSLGDIASLLLESNCYDRVMAEICGVAWLTACEKQIGPIRNRAVWLAGIFEKLRQRARKQISRTLLLGRLSDFMHWESFELAWDRVQPIVIGQGLPLEALNEVRESKSTGSLRHDLANCDGMEAIELLAAATQLFQPRGIRAYRAVNRDELVRMLRMAYDLEELEGDSMFWKMKRWEYRNYQYPLLQRWRSLDPLGVILDQRYWESDLSHVLKSLESQNISVFKMDLDNFKSVNNQLGHSGGDDAIRLYCSIIKQVFARVGEVYRRGGDEIVVIAPGVDKAPAQALAEEARAEIESRFHAWGVERGLTDPPTMSIGVLTTDNKTAMGEIIELLDRVQLQAKKQGKNRVAFFSKESVA